MVVRHREGNLGLVVGWRNDELADPHELAVDRRQQGDVTVDLRVERLAQLALGNRASDPEEPEVGGGVAEVLVETP
jgi:hypothetical protein